MIAAYFGGRAGNQMFTYAFARKLTEINGGCLFLTFQEVILKTTLTNSIFSHILKNTQI